MAKTMPLFFDSLFARMNSHGVRAIIPVEVMNVDQVKTGRFLARLRRGKGFTQEALAEKIGVTNKTISRWEMGVSHS